MKIIDGDNKIRIAGAKVGEHILITLTNGTIKRVIFSTVIHGGIEGYSTTILNNPLSFFPFTNILEVKKDIETDDSGVLKLR